MERFIGTGAAAEFLNLSPITIRSWAANGFLPSYKIGGRRLFKASELDAWVKRPGHARVKRLRSFIAND